MPLLQPRTTSVPLTTYIATTAVLGLWFLALAAVALYLFLHHRKRSKRPRTTPRTGSSGNTAPRLPLSHPTPLPSYLQRTQTPPYSRNNPSLFSATTRAVTFPPIQTPSRADPVPPATPPKDRGPNRITTVSPPRYPVLAAHSTDQGTNEAARRARLATHPAQAANLARLQSMALASDTTDMSAEAGTEVVNAGYMAMLAQRGVPPRDHALLGSDNSADAGGGTGPAFNYPSRMDYGRRGAGGGRYAAPSGQGGRGGRAMAFGQEIGDEDLQRMKPLHMRKMSGM